MKAKIILVAIVAMLSVGCCGGGTEEQQSTTIEYSGA